jgi:hypothetical protein
VPHSFGLDLPAKRFAQSEDLPLMGSGGPYVGADLPTRIAAGVVLHHYFVPGNRFGQAARWRSFCLRAFATIA